MKLSDAIRLGAMMKPQCYGSYHKGKGSCAIGAALDAVGAEECDEEVLWPWLEKLEDCPVCNQADGETIIPHLNDKHRWTREQIADFVQTIEAAQQTPRSEQNKTLENSNHVGVMDRG